MTRSRPRPRHRLVSAASTGRYASPAPVLLDARAVRHPRRHLPSGALDESVDECRLSGARITRHEHGHSFPFPNAFERPFEQIELGVAAHDRFGYLCSIVCTGRADLVVDRRDIGEEAVAPADHCLDQFVPDRLPKVAHVRSD